MINIPKDKIFSETLTHTGTVTEYLYIAFCKYNETEKNGASLYIFTHLLLKLEKSINKV